MTVAFTDCLSFASAIDSVTDLNNSKQIDSIIANHYQVRKQSVRVINILADALYSVFCLRFDDLRRACFAYLSYPVLYAGPVRLLSGISSSQPALIIHFFSVAFFGMLYTLFPFPTPMAVIAAIQMLRHALQIILPLIVKENPYLPVKTLVQVLRLVFWV
jgi:squalene monooxygenase